MLGALRKLGLLLVTLLAVTALTFVVTSVLDGDPVNKVLGDDARPEAKAALREQLRLDRPVHVRYGLWLKDVARGDLGRSVITKEPVWKSVKERAPVTLQIGVVALGIALAGAVPLALLSAYKANTWVDRGVSTSTFGLLAIPNFTLAMILIYLFVEKIDVLPPTGWVYPSGGIVDSLKHTILPALSLGIAELAVFTRLLRADLISTLREDFILMARAKGVPTRRILFRHALRPSAFSLLTVVGVQLGALVGGSIVIEQLFGLPGLGRLLFGAVSDRDVTVVQGVTLVIAASYVIVNFAVDVCYRLLDPRIS